MSATKAARTKTRGRAARRVQARLYAGDEHLLEALCAKLELSQGEVIRRALAVLARYKRVR